jgi:hypothetical protein
VTHEPWNRGAVSAFLSTADERERRRPGDGIPMNRPTSPDRARRALPRWSRLLLAVALVVPLAACGGYGEVYYEEGYDDYYAYDTTGYVYVLNSTAVEDVLTFFLAFAGDPFGPNYLSGPLPPGFEEYIGEFVADYYDAESDTDLGGYITWFDVWVGDYDDAVFEVI